MGYCKQCKVKINDPVSVCPLCHCAVKKEGDEFWRYPEVGIKMKKMQLALRIYLAAAVVVQIVLFYLNTKIWTDMQWSLWTATTFVAVYVGMRMSISNRTGYRSRTIGLTVFATAYIVLIDYELGFQGWSVNYVLPASIILLNIAVIVMIFVNMRNWQSYLIVELFLVLCSGIPMLLIGLGVATETMLPHIAIFFSIGLFVSTVIVGGRKAKTELKRRFHI